MLGYTRHPLIFQFISKASQKRLSTLSSRNRFNSHFQQTFLHPSSWKRAPPEPQSREGGKRESAKQMKNFKLLIGILRTFE